MQRSLFRETLQITKFSGLFGKARDDLQWDWYDGFVGTLLLSMF